MDYDTGDILHVAVVDKRQVGLKSPNMEKAAFVESLQVIQDNKINVKEVVTDAHPSIRAYMSKFITFSYQISALWRITSIIP